MSWFSVSEGDLPVEGEVVRVRCMEANRVRKGVYDSNDVERPYQVIGSSTDYFDLWKPLPNHQR